MSFEIDNFTATVYRILSICHSRETYTVLSSMTPNTSTNHEKARLRFYH